MSSPLLSRRGISAFALLLPLLATAQSNTQAPAQALAMPSKSLDPAISYQSAFDNYKGFEDGDVMSWKVANNEVRASDSMTGHDMGAMKGATGQEAPGAMPGQNMKNMPSDSATGETNKDVRGADGAKTAPKAGMSGHDMNQMKPVTPPGKSKAQPARTPKDSSQSARMGSMAGHDMGAMAGDDMGSMAKPSAGKRAVPQRSKSREVADPKPMMDHGEMKQ